MPEMTAALYLIVVYLFCAVVRLRHLDFFNRAIQ
jgi:hypothetical protein